jgi:hypothetical protein
MGVVLFFYFAPAMGQLLLWLGHLMLDAFEASADGLGDLWNSTWAAYSKDLIGGLFMTLFSLFLTALFLVWMLLLGILCVVILVLSYSPVTSNVLGVGLGCALGYAIWVWVLPLVWLFVESVARVITAILRLITGGTVYIAAGTIGAYAQHRYEQRWRAAIYGEVQARFQDPRHFFWSILCGSTSFLLMLAGPLGWIQ